MYVNQIDVCELLLFLSLMFFFSCQFVVKVKGDYAPYTKNPDLLVDWSSIEQINLFGSSEEPQCPIW